MYIFLSVLVLNIHCLKTSDVTHRLSVRSCTAAALKNRNVPRMKPLFWRSISMKGGWGKSCQTCMQIAIMRHPTFFCLTFGEGKCTMQSVPLDGTAASQSVRKVSYKPSLPLVQGLAAAAVYRYVAVFLSSVYTEYWVSFKIILSKENNH